MTARATRVLVMAALVAVTASQPAPAQPEKQILGITKDSWIGFRDYNGRQLVYFTHLEAWRCGIARVRYSINGDGLDQEWTLQPCDPDNPNTVTTVKPYISLPFGSAQSVSVQLTFADGSQSDVVTFTP